MRLPIVAAMRWDELFGHDIVIVSGKGGTGKTSVAAALATSATRAGKRVLLAETEGRGQIARSLGVPDPGEREAMTPPGFTILSITPGQAAREYLRLYIGLDRVSRTLIRSGVLDQVIAVAPGFRDLLMNGKLYELTRERRSNPRDAGRPVYDLVVVDGPPTGQIVAFLEAPGVFVELVRVGRIKGQAGAIRRMLRERTAVVLVTTLEEMAVAETIDALAAIRQTGVPVAAVVANRARPSVTPRGTRRAFSSLSPDELARIAGEAGLALAPGEASAMVEVARRAERRHGLEAAFLRAISQGPTLILPEILASPEPARVEALAAQMTDLSSGPASGPAGRHRTGAAPMRRRSRPRLERSLDRHLDGARIVVVCGSGGVGKTTISSALAVHFAESGRRTVLLTVDPALRLATALRLPTAVGERTRVKVGRGRTLEAIQLDTQRTFDGLIQRLAGTRERRDRILSNPFYRRIADTLSGTHEYMAMEKLYELAVEEDHELIVIDTPPTRSALSFLDAPNRLTDFLGGRFLRWMLWPSARAGRMTLSVARFGATAFAKTVGRLVGAETLADTMEFLAAFEGMYGGFKERARRVLTLLRSPECVFLVVTSPASASLEEAAFFVQRLAEGGMRAGAVVVNRWHEAPEAPSLLGNSDRANAVIQSLSEGKPDQRASGAVLCQTLRAERRSALETEAIAAFAERRAGAPLVASPELDGDVHDVAGLRRVARELFG
jgi:anion-transporting  ArsA/GET3 family ATPase